MADPAEDQGPLSFIFNANAPAGAPGSYSALDMRRKLALALMAQNKKGFPKNLGEGLTSIGDALAERAQINQLMRAETARDASLGAAAAAAATGVPAPASPSPRASYAPPGDTESDTAAPEATAAPMDTATDLTPAEAKAGVSGGDYNLLDAQAGMKRTGHGRVQDAVTAAYPNNPDMQAYASQLAAGEQQVPDDTSRTGARGPWQFVPGTAKQYGLTNPDDPNASAQALKAFTANNAAIFERINGRPPTMAELALMHQQGGQTGAGMIAGIGNASPRNLALNNVPAGAGPAQAVSAIKNYYGMPDRPVNARDAVAQALTMRNTAQAVPQPNPTSTGGPTMPPTSPTGPTPIPSTPALAGGPAQGLVPDQRMAFAGLPPEITTGVSAAPPAASAIRPIPRQPGPQVAQAGPPSVSPPGTVYPPPAEAPAEPRGPKNFPAVEPKSPRQLANERALLQAQASGDPQMVEIYKTAVANDEAQRVARQTQHIEQFKTQLAEPGRELELQKAEDERQARARAEALSKQLGQIPQEVYVSRLNKSQENISGLPAAMQSVKRARDLVDNNKMFLGGGADINTSLQKLSGVMGFPVDPRTSGTEQFKTAMGNIMAMSRKAIVGAGAQSEAELQLLQKTSAADTRLEPETIKQSLAAAEHLMLTSALQHQQQVRRFAGEEPERQAQVYGQWAVPSDTMIDMVPKTAVNKLMQHANDPQVLRDFDNTFHTPGLSRDVLRRYGGQ